MAPRVTWEPGGQFFAFTTEPHMSEGWLKVAQGATEKLLQLLIETIRRFIVYLNRSPSGEALENVIGFGNTLLWPIAYANELIAR